MTAGTMTETTKDMTTETIAKQLGLSEMILKMNVGDVTQAESLIQPDPAGNCLNWVMGHMIASRSGLLRGLGGEPVWSEAECAPYDRNAAPLGGDEAPKTIDELRHALELSGQRLRERIGGLSAAKLAEKAPFSPMNNPEETIGSLLALFAFHDAYHAGQTGLLRRIIGRPALGL